MRFWLVPVFALALPAAPSWAVGTWDLGCDGVVAAAGDGRTVLPAAVQTTRPEAVIGCYSFLNADGTHYGTVFQIASGSASLDFDPDTSGAAGGTATLKVFWCPQLISPQVTADATLELECIDLGGANGSATLDGTEGEPSTHNRYKVLYPGVYFIKVTAACAGADTCVVTVKGN